MHRETDRQSESMKEFADIKTLRKTMIFREREREERRKTERERKTEQD